jgi:hypothetical protein
MVGLDFQTKPIPTYLNNKNEYLNKKNEFLNKKNEYLHKKTNDRAVDCSCSSAAERKKDSERGQEVRPIGCDVRWE